MKRILAVDDEPELLAVMDEFFEGRYVVTTATSGPAALAAFTRERPDVVFLDVNMPGPSGIDVLQTMRELDPTVPVVMVTVSSEVVVAEECLKRGAFAYVPKPFDLHYMDHIAALAVEHRGGRA